MYSVLISLTYDVQTHQTRLQFGMSFPSQQIFNWNFLIGHASDSSNLEVKRYPITHGRQDILIALFIYTDISSIWWKSLNFTDKILKKHSCEKV